MTDIEHKKEVLATLKRAYVRIESEDTWCRYAGARNIKGKICSTHDVEAVKFCSLGAIDVECPSESLYTSCVEALRQGRLSISAFNDNSRHVEVIAHWRNVIETLESELETLS